MTYQLTERLVAQWVDEACDKYMAQGAHFFYVADAAYQAGRDSMKAECVKAVDDAGGDNTDYHMNAMKELK